MESPVANILLLVDGAVGASSLRLRDVAHTRFNSGSLNKTRVQNFLEDACRGECKYTKSSDCDASASCLSVANPLEENAFVMVFASMLWLFVLLRLLK